MLQIIKNHNYLNGNIFSLIEFLVASLIIVPFAGYFIIHGPWLYSTIAVGIVFNCLTVSLVAVQSLVKKEKSIGILRLYSDKDLREKMRAEYPNLSRETFILCVAILVPFLLPVTFVYSIFSR
jgi:hypothetical protein